MIRAEAMASDKYAALDLAWAKLVERLRRARDRNKVSRVGRHRKESTAEALAKMPIADAGADADSAGEADAPVSTDRTNGRIKAEGDSPVVLREKSFAAAPIGIEEALNRMELVGHDFYLFIDEPRRSLRRLPSQGLELRRHRPRRGPRTRRGPHRVRPRADPQKAALPFRGCRLLHVAVSHTPRGGRGERLSRSRGRDPR